MANVGAKQGMEAPYRSDLEEIPLSGAQLASLMEGVLSRGSSVRLRARGASMFPFIRDGDVISVAPLGGRAPALGDVVAFRRQQAGQASVQTLVVHRVVRRAKEGFMILGDNQPPGQPDGPVDPAHILGIVTRVERGSRDIRLGLGPERAALAWLARRGLLQPLTRAASLASALRGRLSHAKEKGAFFQK